MECIDFFPRSIVKGKLSVHLLDGLVELSCRVLADPDASVDASNKLAGQLSQQRELRVDHPSIQDLWG